MKLSIPVCLALVVCGLVTFAYLASDSGAAWMSQTAANAPHLVPGDQPSDSQIAMLDPAIGSVQIDGLGPSATGIGTVLTITNVSNKRILEVHAYWGRLLVGKRFWGIENEPINPGGRAILQFSYEPAPHTIKIVAVVFEDGTGEGDQRVLDDAFTFSEAYRRQLRQNIGLLSDFAKGGELFQGSTVRDGLARLRQRMEAEPPSPHWNEEINPFDIQGRRSATAWITIPVRHWESWASAHESDLSQSDAATRLQKMMSHFMDQCLALDKRLAERTPKRSWR